MTTVVREAKVVNPLGLHARPAAQFVKLASSFGSAIEVSKDSMSVNGKSIMGVMMLAAECGSVITLKATGPDSQAAIEALHRLIEEGFGEG
jgi:phosphocarrier protein